MGLISAAYDAADGALIESRGRDDVFVRKASLAISRRRFRATVAALRRASDVDAKGNSKALRNGYRPREVVDYVQTYTTVRTWLSRGLPVEPPYVAAYNSRPNARCQRGA